MARALPPPAIPAGPEELTAPWLSHALGGDVRSFRTEILGEGEGFVGTIARIRLEANGEAPRSAIAKFPISVDQNRALGEQLGAYEREIRFYQELAADVPLCTPRHYYSDMDPNPLKGREEQFLRFLDRWPDWLIRLLMPALRWLTAKSRRRYVLLLEDLAPVPGGRIGDQVAGCRVDEAEAALRGLGAMHAAYHGRVDTPELWWLPRIDALARWFQIAYRQNWPTFAARYRGRFPRMVELAPWLAEHAVEVVQHLGALPCTLLHGDFRLDNLCLRDEGGHGVSVVAFDWQGAARGPGRIDVAYFISGNLRPELAAECEQPLLGAYVDEISRRGVELSKRELRGYELAKLWLAWRLSMGTDELDLANERGLALWDSWLERLEALLPERPAELLG